MTDERRSNLVFKVKVRRTRITEAWVRVHVDDWPMDEDNCPKDQVWLDRVILDSAEGLSEQDLYGEAVYDDEGNVIDLSSTDATIVEDLYHAIDYEEVFG